jgi:hypothetical protein
MHSNNNIAEEMIGGIASTQNEETVNGTISPVNKPVFNDEHIRVHSR